MEDYSINQIVKYVIDVFIGLFVLVLLMGSWGTIGAGERGIKTRFGAVIGTLEQGLYFKVPLMDSVHKMDVKTRTLSYEKSDGSDNQLSGASKDLQDVSLGVVVTYHVDPSKVGTIYSSYSSVDNYESSVIAPLIRTIVKTDSAGYTAEELVTKRADFIDKVFKDLTDALGSKDAILEGSNITNFDFSVAFAQAIEAKVTAVQNAEAQKNKLEQVKYEAQQTIETAKAEAEAIRIQAQAINSQGGADYVKKLIADKWDGKGCTSYCGLEASTGLLISK